MPDRTIKRRLQDCDAALASDDGPIFSTVARDALSRMFLAREQRHNISSAMFPTQRA
jgi:hypothetical protein